MDDNELKEMADRLSPGAAEACRKMTTSWKFPGHRTFNANGALALHHAQVGSGVGFLCESQTDYEKGHMRRAYRLTAIGARMKDYLQGK